MAHPELNPIEMVWSFVKRSVASRNLKFKLNAVEELTREQMVKVRSNFPTISQPCLQRRRQVPRVEHYNRYLTKLEELLYFDD